jgi:xylitol oxidase
MNTEQRNWAGNITYSAKNWHQPSSIEELQAIVKAAQQVKVLGSRHSFNRIVDTAYEGINLQDWNQVLSLDVDAKTVTIEAGMRYGELAVYLQERGFALHNLASLPHISVVGAISTATHGSGVQNANLASALVALELINADAELLTVSRKENSHLFSAAGLGLGAMGIITKVTLAIQATYNMRQVLYQDLLFEQVYAHFDEIMASAYSVSLFTDWQGETIKQAWLKQRVDETNEDIAPRFFTARAATEKLHPLPDVSAENCTEQMGISGAWHERLPHFRMEFTPSQGDELQSEYFVPRQYAVEAIKALRGIAEHIAPLLLVSEIRSIAADDFWMSPCYQQDCVAFHFTWRLNEEAVFKLLPIMEKALLPYQVRPHWGKLFALETDYLQTQYENWGKFQELLKEFDPQAKFRNPFLEKLLFGLIGE